MKTTEQRRALACAVAAARAAGQLMRKNLRRTKQINEASRHDIKLELDVRCQRLIEARLQRDFPAVAFLGEEGESVAAGAAARWVVDPIDGTVNYAYGIPHACVSIALQVQRPDGAGGHFETLAGAVYDPFLDEMWTALRGGRARLNGAPIRTSRRKRLDEAVVATGYAKSQANLEKSLPFFNELARRSRKVRMMGAAALALTYVACGRFDAYVERSVRLWDIAAGGLIIECAGGEFHFEPADEPDAFRLIATNGLLRKHLPPLP